jgi:uncharacterized membrane protein YsdA (DUF1294 family)/cold shock CspA family protein
MPSQDRAGRRQGVLADWNDDRGFGFIKATAGGSRLFVHVSAFPRGERPVIGCEVTYAEFRDERGRARAGAVQYLTSPPTRKPGGGGMRLVLAVVASFFALLMSLVVLDKMPVTLLAADGLLSIVAFFFYGKDKSAAEQGRWRTPESTLHMLALVGGWPGALIAQRFFRHKTTKQPFRTIFWITVMANCVALAWFMYETPVTLL